MVRNVLEGKFEDACSGLKQLYDLGYSPTDIITTLFRIIKNYDMAEYLKLEFLKVWSTRPSYLVRSSLFSFQISDVFSHGPTGNWICPHENLRWSRLISSVIWSPGQAFTSSGDSQSFLSGSWCSEPVICALKIGSCYKHGLGSCMFRIGHFSD